MRTENYFQMSRLPRLIAVIAPLIASPFLGAQVPDADKTASAAAAVAPAAATPPSAPSSSSAAPSPDAGGPSGPNLLGMFDPQTGNVTWQGKTFDPGTSKVLLGRFERYLVTPEAKGEADLAYNQTLDEISATLQGRKGGTLDQRIAQAWRLLYKAADYDGDSRLSETLANSLISYWQANSKIRDILQTNKDLEKKRESAESNITRNKDWDRNAVLENIRNSKSATATAPTRDYATDPYKKRLDDAEKRIADNEKLETTSRLNQKLEFQGMILQFFAQRRFQHVLIALDFYRYLFAGEQGDMEAAEGLKKQLLGGADIRITTSAIEALTREAMREVDTGSKAVQHLLDKGEIYEASLRMMEVFHLGEFLPVVKTFPIDQKDKLRASVHGMADLTNAIEAKDFDRASTLMTEIKAKVPDFDAVKPNAIIVAAKQTSMLALQQAGYAAKQGNMKDAEDAIRAAMVAWPSNPAIGKFSTGMEQRSDVVDVAGKDFDRLLANDEFRAIYNDRFRYAAALHDDADRTKKFTDIMRRMERVETAISQAKELERTKNVLGAWEIVERAYRASPDDLQINQVRSDLAVKASAFASLIAQADDQEKQGKSVDALLAFLAAKDKYPASYFADDGIVRLCGNILESRATAGSAPAAASGSAK